MVNATGLPSSELSPLPLIGDEEIRLADINTLGCELDRIMERRKELSDVIKRMDTAIESINRRFPNMETRNLEEMRQEKTQLQDELFTLQGYHQKVADSYRSKEEKVIRKAS